MSESILITGGGGYLGSMLARMLLSYGHPIHLADIAFNSLSQDLATANSHVHLEKLDLSDPVATEALCTRLQPFWIFHFAARIERARDASLLPSMLEVNMKGTLNLLTALKDVDYRMFSFSGTSEVYGVRNPLPFTEDMPPEPVSPYSLSKWMAEEVIRSWSAALGKPWLIFRIFNFYGSGMPQSTFIPQLLHALERNEPFRMTPGEQKRDYLHIDDLLWYIRESAFSGKFNKEVVNLCSGEAASMRAIADQLSALFTNPPLISKALPYRENEIWEIRGDNSKLRNAFPLHKPMALQDGLKLLAAEQA